MGVLDSISKSRLDKHTTTSHNMILTWRRLRSLDDELLTIRPTLTGIAAAFARVIRHLDNHALLVPERYIPLTLGIVRANMTG
jgi:ABC-type Fe3+ transport system permease subunit